MDQNQKLIAYKAFNLDLVRRCYSSAGFGAIAEPGPEGKSVTLDPVGTIRFNDSNLIGLIDCNAKNWEKALSQ